MALWLCGLVALWLFIFVVRPGCVMALWLCGLVALVALCLARPWDSVLSFGLVFGLVLCGRMALRLCGLVALWLCGLVALWPCGVMALRP